MKKFSIAQKDLFAQFLNYNYSSYRLRCDVLFPDGTIVKNCILHLKHGGNIQLEITIYGVVFKDWVGVGTERFKDLTYKILEKKPRNRPKPPS